MKFGSSRSSTIDYHRYNGSGVNVGAGIVQYNCLWTHKNALRASAANNEHDRLFK